MDENQEPVASNVTHHTQSAGGGCPPSAGGGAMAKMAISLPVVFADANEANAAAQQQLLDRAKAVIGAASAAGIKAAADAVLSAAPRTAAPLPGRRRRRERSSGESVRGRGGSSGAKPGANTDSRA